MTLVEVVASLALLASLLVAVLLAKAGYSRQAARAERRLQAVAAADALLTAWHREPGILPPEASGTVAGDEQLVWRTRVVPNPEAEGLGARAVRLEVLDERASASAAPVLASVEFLVEPVSRGPAITHAAAGEGSRARQPGKHKSTGQTHAPGIHHP